MKWNPLYIFKQLFLDYAEPEPEWRCVCSVCVCVWGGGGGGRPLSPLSCPIKVRGIYMRLSPYFYLFIFTYTQGHLIELHKSMGHLHFATPNNKLRRHCPCMSYTKKVLFDLVISYSISYIRRPLY